MEARTTIAPGPGVTYSDKRRDELPTYVRALDDERRQEWIDRQNKLNAVAKTCDCGRKLRAHEVEPHTLMHAPNGNVRAAAGTVLALTEDDRQATMELLKGFIHGR